MDKESDCHILQDIKQEINEVHESDLTLEKQEQHGEYNVLKIQFEEDTINSNESCTRSNMNLETIFIKEESNENYFQEDTVSYVKRKIDLDVEQFICEVEKRPAIWNIGSEEYSNRELRNRAWEELVILFIENENATNEEKQDCGQQLARRWKSLRDCYLRELHKQRNCKPDTRRKRSTMYSYYKHLSFLYNVVTRKENIENPQNSQIESNETSSSTNKSNERKRKNLSKSVEEKQDIVNSVRKKSIICKKECQSKNDIDSDRIFLLSLLAPLKTIPQYARFGVKKKIMDVIDREINIYVQSEFRNDGLSQDPTLLMNQKDIFVVEEESLSQDTTSQSFSLQKGAHTNLSDSSFDVNSPNSSRYTHNSISKTENDMLENVKTETNRTCSSALGSTVTSDSDLDIFSDN